MSCARGLAKTTAAPSRGEGALVVTVEREGPADWAGVAPADLIVRVGDKEVRHPRDATGIVLGTEPGTRIPVDVMRNGQRTTVTVQLAPIPTQPSLP